MPWRDPGAYEAWFDLPLGRLADAAEKKLIGGFAVTRPGGRLLDAGCGTGHLTAVLSRPGVKVVGLDASLDMLEYARSKYQLSALVQGDVEALPFAAGSFDTVVMLTVLEFLERPEAALSETFRVLEPSGQFVIGFLNRRGPWGALRRIRGLLGNAFWRKARFYGRREMAGLLSRAGYTAIKAKGTLFNSFVLLGGYKSPLTPLFQRGEIKSLRLPLRQGPLFQRGALVPCGLRFVCSLRP